MKIIVNADDFGLCNSVNEAIIEVFHAGNLSSATLMANMPGTDEAIAMAKANPKLGVGLHFCLTEGKPLSDAKTLVDEKGTFLNRPTLLKAIYAGKVKASEVCEELEAQFIKLQTQGVALTHIDSHQHIHMSPKLFDMLHGTLRTIGLPIRIVRPAAILQPALRNLNPVKVIKQFVNFMSAGQILKHNFMSNTHLVSIHDGYNLEKVSKQTYLEMIKHARAKGVLEIMIHPFKEGESLRALYPLGSTKDTFIKTCLSEYEILRKPAVFAPGTLANFKTAFHG